MFRDPAEINLTGECVGTFDLTNLQNEGYYENPRHSKPNVFIIVQEKPGEFLVHDDELPDEIYPSQMILNYLRQE